MEKRKELNESTSLRGTWYGLFFPYDDFVKEDIIRIGQGHAILCGFDGDMI